MNIPKLNDTLDNFTLLEVYSTRGITFSQVPENEDHWKVKKENQKEEIFFDDTLFLEDNVEFPVGKLSQSPQADLGAQELEAELKIDPLLEIKPELEDEEDMFADTSNDQLGGAQNRVESLFNKTKSSTENSLGGINDELKPLLADEISIEEHVLPEIDDKEEVVSSSSTHGSRKIEAFGNSVIQVVLLPTSNNEQNVMEMYDPVKKCLVTKLASEVYSYNQRVDPLNPPSSIPTCRKTVPKPTNQIKTKSSKWGLPDRQILEKSRLCKLAPKLNNQIVDFPNPISSTPICSKTVTEPTNQTKTKIEWGLADQILEKSRLRKLLAPKLNYQRVDSLNPISSTPTCSQTVTEPTNKTKINLSEWGLPDKILEKYHSRKLITMFDWQAECLSTPGVCNGSKHLIYSAPTSAGKTLVAEILAIKSIIERGKKVIFILPFVSIVREKMFYFRDIFDNTDIRVEGFMGSYNPPGGFQSVKLAMCTIEKANNLINKLLQEGSLSEIGAVIVDEMHLLGDPNRGYLLELLLAKIRYISLKDENVNVQIIGMSATVPNIETLAKWLDAELYVTNFRPIPLHEQVTCDNKIYNNKFEVIRELLLMDELEMDVDVDYILHLCLETICQQSCSVLIFCPTKNWCENLAQQIASAFFKLGSSAKPGKMGQGIRTELNSDMIKECLEQLKYCPVGLDECLRKTVAFGVAFHHAGLTMDERDIIEAAFKNGAIRVLVATSTLSSGVNLPARRVIIRTPIFHGKLIDTLVYRQMIGRAGRMGKDTEGESILVCQKSNFTISQSLLKSNLEPIESCLAVKGKLKRALLEIIASDIASSREDIALFTSCTLMAQNEAYDDLITETLNFLTTNEFVRFQDSRNIATSLGKACLSSSLPPEEGLSLLTELEQARSCLALETELHLIYLVTPYSACHQWGLVDWMFYMNLWEKLPVSMKKVGELVGVRESFIVHQSQGHAQLNTEASSHRFLVHKRFFVALVLQDLVNEIPLPKVCAKFNVNRGLLQSLQQTASTFAGMVTAFSKQLGWTSIELLVSQFQDRLQFGVSRDLLDLMRMPILNAKCARALYAGGITTLAQLANSSANSIEDILHKVAPFESDKVRDGESEFACKERNKFRNVWITGKEGLTEREAAELLLNHARDYLKNDMGLKEAHWNSSSPNVDKSLSVNASSKSLFSNNSNADHSIFEQSLRGNISRTSLNSLNSSGDLIIKSSQDENSLVVLDTKNRPPLSAKKRRRYDDCLPLASPKKMRGSKSVVHRCIGLKNCLIQDATSEDIRRIFFGNQSLALSFEISNHKIEAFAFSYGTVVYYLKYQDNTDDLIQKLVGNKDLTIRLYNAKENIKILKKCANADWQARVEDPALADWLVHPDIKGKTIEQMVLSYYPLEKIDSSTFKSCNPKLKICMEAAATWHLVDTIKDEIRVLKRPMLLKTYEVQMACAKILSRMEIVGFGVDEAILKNQIEIMKRQLESIEKKAYNWAGRRFSFASSRDVTKVLDMLKTRQALGKRRTSTSTSKKQALEKLHHPLADTIVQWRKLNCIMQQTARPLLLAVENGRVHGTCILYTATGRISMREPSIQNVAKDFEIIDCESKETTTISCRNAFVAKDGCILISADYCQLELRVLAHLSKDPFLRLILEGKEDVFVSIAAKWNKILKKEVTDTLRNQAKQLCYGIIYGMTAPTMAEHLNIDEKLAAVLMDTFQNTFPTVKTYIQDVVTACQQLGFVETISGRKRYLPLQEAVPVLQGKFGRQAVNTTIQGSAADLVKQAMVHLEEKCSSLEYNPKLVLHLHDELIYEIPEEHLNDFAVIMKRSMESSIKLSIPFPVKVKQGKCWGQMTNMVI